MTQQSSKEKKTRHVDDEELRLLGFSERDIADAKRMEALGLFNMEPPPEIGAKMPDGTIFAGWSPATHERMYTTPADAPLTMTFNDAQKYAATLDAHGHKDWRAPTKAELNVLFNNRAAIGRFDTSGSGGIGLYWSSSPYDTEDAWCQRFSDGALDFGTKGFHLSVRLVRTQPPKVT
jgi:hypothetical protein